MSASVPLGTSSFSATVGTVSTTYAGSVEQHFLKLLAEEIAIEEDTINAGHLLDYAAYKQHTGRRAGLKKAEELWSQAVRDIQQSENAALRRKF